MTQLREILSAFAGDLWAVEPIKFAQIAQRLALRAGGERLSPTEIRAALGGDPAERGQASKAAGIAVLPIYGLVLNRTTQMDESSGVYGLNRLASVFDAMVADDGVRAIVLDLDTPGGMMSGTPEFAAKIFAARGTKPIIAVANQLAASAGYWLAAACDEVVASPSALLGSIGVMAVHKDTSAADAAEGVKFTIIAAPQFKAEGNSTEPLSEEARAQIEARVLEGVKMFETAVAEYRGVGRSDVSAGFGQGRVFTAKAAVKAGLADRVATLDETLARLGGRTRSTGRSRPGDRAAQLAAALGLELGSDTLYVPTLDAVFDTSAHAVEPGRVLLIHAGDSRRETAPDIAVHAPAAAPTTPAPVAANTKELTMTEAELQAQATEVARLKTENARLAAEALVRDGYEQLAKANPEYATQLVGWRAEGKTPDQAKDLIAADLRARVQGKPALIVGHVGADRATERPWGTPQYHALAERVAKGAIKPDDRRYKAAASESLGEQLKAIAAATSPAGTFIGAGVVDPRLSAALATGSASAQVGADGGFAIQKEFTVDLLSSAFNAGALLSRCDTSEIGPNADGLEVMYLDETSRATGSRWGGIQVTRGAEGDTATAKKPKFGKWESRLEDILGLAYVSNRMLNDAASIGAVFAQGFQEEFLFTIEDELVRGTGAGQMLGILTAPGTVSQAKETGQVTKTVVFENLANMWTKVHPRSQPRGAWFYNPELFTQLLQLQIGTGTSASLVFMPPGGISGLPYGTIFGQPAIPIEYASGAGTLGDFFYADFSRYKVITKGGLQSDESMHVRFLTNEMAFRWITRINGAPKDRSAITPYKTANSTTWSPFVTLAAR